MAVHQMYYAEVSNGTFTSHADWAQPTEFVQVVCTTCTLVEHIPTIFLLSCPVPSSLGYGSDLYPGPC